MIHEFLHTLGFHHEHNRFDRDDYVQIHYENIIPEKIENFKKITAKAYYNLPYDGTSIMHYKSDAFSMNGFDTITSRVGSKGWQYGTATAPQPPRNMIEFFLEQFLGSNFEPNKQSRTIIRIDRLRHNENQDNL